jgi:hypothetical protein
MSLVQQKETQNGDLTFASTNHPLLDVFSNANRATKDLKDYIYEKMDDCWAVDPLRTLKLIFYKRDCRGGAGEKDVFFWMYQWLIEKHLDVAEHALQWIYYYGSYKDYLRIIVANRQFYAPVMQFLAHKLDGAWKQLEAGSPIQEDLIAKWLPTESCQFDRQIPELIPDLAMSVWGAPRHKSYVTYRKNLVQIRKLLSVVEANMTAKNWSSIDYEKVPSLAMKKYKDAFMKHDEKRFSEFLESARNGSKKINVDQLVPHELLKEIRSEDPTAVTQWMQMVANYTKNYPNLAESACMCDVSGSMDSPIGFGSFTAMDISLSVATLMSYVSNYPLVAFSDAPYEFKFDDNATPGQRVRQIRSTTNPLNTDLRAAMEIYLNKPTQPKYLVIISDMEFDCLPSWNISTFQSMQLMYKNAGLQMPKIVFWKVNSKYDSNPVVRDNMGVCIITGFSPKILTSVLAGDISNPLSAMLSVLNSERYARITLGVLH